MAKLTESGYGRAEGELPIDINYQKLSEWLLTRKKMVADWHKRVQAIQGKITEAAKDLPPGLLASLPGGADAPIDYFRAVAIRDKLAEGGERTLFGGLAGAAGVWDTIVKAYEKQSEWRRGALCDDNGAAQLSSRDPLCVAHLPTAPRCVHGGGRVHHGGQRGL